MLQTLLGMYFKVEQIVERRLTEPARLVVLLVEDDVRRHAGLPADAVVERELRLQRAVAVVVAVIQNPLDVGARMGRLVLLDVRCARRVVPDDERRARGLCAMSPTPPTPQWQPPGAAAATLRRELRAPQARPRQRLLRLKAS